VIIDDKRIMPIGEKILSREVVLEKTPDGKESIKIIVKALALNGRGSNQEIKDKGPCAIASARPTDLCNQSDWFI
jgi:hypothetical protein